VSQMKVSTSAQRTLHHEFTHMSI